MSIIKNLEKAAAAVAVNTFNGGDLGFRIGQLAIKAVTNGITSPDGTAYMSLFADNEDQLKRLTVATPGEDSWLPQARAYIVSNAICDAQTGTRTQNNVKLEIDDPAISEASDGKVVKPFPIEI